MSENHGRGFGIHSLRSQSIRGTHFRQVSSKNNSLFLLFESERELVRDPVAFAIFPVKLFSLFLVPHGFFAFYLALFYLFETEHVITEGEESVKVTSLQGQSTSGQVSVG